MSPLARLRSPQFLFIFILFVILIGIAHLAAERRAAKDADLLSALQNRPPEVWKGQEGEFPAPHSVVYYRIVFTIWISTVLLTVALCFYALRRPTAPSSYWVLFWTFSYLAYLLHFYWAAGVLFGWDFAGPQGILHSRIGTNPDPEKVVCNPIPDLVLTVWWGLDVVLAWFVFASPCPKWLRIERGAVSLFTFVAFFGATVLAAKAGPVVRALGVLMVVSVLVCYLARIALQPMQPQSLSAFLFVSVFRLVNLIRPWYRLPTLFGVMNLAALREVLRARNLHTTSREPEGKEVIPVTNAAGRTPRPAANFDPALIEVREVDGYYNDLHDTEMGSGSEDAPLPALSGTIVRSNPGARFGRNVPLEEAHPEAEPKLLQPNPRDISERLLARTTFRPAPILNYLAAAWIQFETHDWFFHGNPQPGNEFSIDVRTRDPWGPGPMRIRRTPPDPTRTPNDGPWPPTYVNAESHWWDASQIYGSDAKTIVGLRRDPDGNLVPGGKLYVENGLLPLDPATRKDMSGFTGNWWIGLTLLHTLFTLEHNTLCEHLHREYPHWSEDRVFNTARLVNAALMAKIHTVEWTTAILPNPVLQVGMNANWWGIFGANIKRAFGRVSHNEGFSGIPGSETNHHAAPYALTEEFVSVYRMHPLMRDDVPLHRNTDGSFVGAVPMLELLNEGARAHIALPNAPASPAVNSMGSMADWFYSFGICNPGALVLRNFPNWLRNLDRPPEMGGRIDLASIDVMRDRERGVPRYNRFRELFHLPRIRSFEEMCTSGATPEENADLAKELKAIYGDVNRVDLMVGLYAEAPPPLFGFSDTAFRVFILMASRRLKSDRFFTTDFTPEVYSPFGMDWISKNGMLSILLRHYPEIAPALRGVDNAFAPWKTLDKSRAYQPYESREGLANRSAS
jgi:Animal haem peroxidase